MPNKTTGQARPGKQLPFTTVDGALKYIADRTAANEKEKQSEAKASTAQDSIRDNQPVAITVGGTQVTLTVAQIRNILAQVEDQQKDMSEICFTDMVDEMDETDRDDDAMPDLMPDLTPETHMNMSPDIPVPERAARPAQGRSAPSPKAAKAAKTDKAVPKKAAGRAAKRKTAVRPARTVKTPANRKELTADKTRTAKTALQKPAEKKAEKRVPAAGADAKRRPGQEIKTGKENTRPAPSQKPAPVQNTGKIKMPAGSESKNTPPQPVTAARGKNVPQQEPDKVKTVPPRVEERKAGAPKVFRVTTVMGPLYAERDAQKQPPQRMTEERQARTVKTGENKTFPSAGQQPARQAEHTKAAVQIHEKKTAAHPQPAHSENKVHLQKQIPEKDIQRTGIPGEHRMTLDQVEAMAKQNLRARSMMIAAATITLSSGRMTSFVNSQGQRLTFVRQQQANEATGKMEPVVKGYIDGKGVEARSFIQGKEVDDRKATAFLSGMMDSMPEKEIAGIEAAIKITEKNPSIRREELRLETDDRKNRRETEKEKDGKR